MTTAWTVYTNENLFLTKRKKENWQIGEYTAKLTFLWYDNFGKKERSLQMKGKITIPKIILKKFLPC